MIIWVAVISFGLWGINKCSKDDFKDIREKALDLPATESVESGNDEPADADATLSLRDTSITANSQAVSPATAPVTSAPASRPTPAPAAEPVLSRLYVTIDGLKIRSDPSLEGTVIEQLPLYATVFFMNEVTDSTQKINLGRAIADEPWVKVKSNKGSIGWVYGAGVHYHKIKNEDAY